MNTAESLACEQLNIQFQKKYLDVQKYQKIKCNKGVSDIYNYYAL